MRLYWLCLFNISQKSLERFSGKWRNSLFLNYKTTTLAITVKLKMSIKEAHRHSWYEKYVSAFCAINFPWFFCFLARQTTLIFSKSANCWNFVNRMTTDFPKKLKMSKKEAHRHSWYEIFFGTQFGCVLLIFCDAI